MDNLPIAFVVIIAILAAMLVWYLRDPKVVVDGAVAAGKTTWSSAKRASFLLGILLGATALIAIILSLGGWHLLAIAAVFALLYSKML